VRGGRGLTGKIELDRVDVPHSVLRPIRYVTKRGTEMADKAMDVYLNDHLAGALLGSNLAEQLRSTNTGTALGQLMESLGPEIEDDRQTLIDLMDQMGTSKNPVKQATTWMAEKASRPKFSGLTSGEPELGNFYGPGEPHARGGGKSMPVEGPQAGRGPVRAVGVSKSRRLDRKSPGATRRART
jgi:hypothetical protein